MLKELKKTGLNKNEAKVYTSCLELGTAKASEIAKNADINRSTVYGVLDNLVNKGLISYVDEEGVRKFHPQDPDVLLELLEERKKEVETILPDLKKTFKNNNVVPKIQFFEGKIGAKKIYKDTLECKSKKIYEMIRVKDYVDFPNKEFAKEYVEMRADRDITAFILHPAYGDIYKEIYGKPSEKYKRRSRYLPPELFYVSMMMIYDNKVAIISTEEENFGFIIESREFSSAMKAIHKFLWNIGVKQPTEKLDLDFDSGKWGEKL